MSSLWGRGRTGGAGGKGSLADLAAKLEAGEEQGGGERRGGVGAERRERERESRQEADGPSMPSVASVVGGKSAVPATSDAETSSGPAPGTAAAAVLGGRTRSQIQSQSQGQAEIQPQAPQGGMTSAASKVMPSATTTTTGTSAGTSAGTSTTAASAAPSSQRVGLEAATAAVSEAAAAVSGTEHFSAVKLDGVSLLKIIRHCNQGYPEICTGSLLGLDLDANLEVTNCFPFPNDLADEDEGGNQGQDSTSTSASLGQLSSEIAEIDAATYETDMMKLLKDVNVDSNNVGWYRSVQMGNYCTRELIEEQYRFQEEQDQRTGKAKGVLILYDPEQTTRGVLSLRAVRLTKKFMNAYRQYEQQTNELANASRGTSLSSPFMTSSSALANDPFKLLTSEIFEEIPVEISNPSLVKVLLEDLRDATDESFTSSVHSSALAGPRKGVDQLASAPSALAGRGSFGSMHEKSARFDTDFDRLDLSTNPYLETNLQHLVEEIDELQNEQSKNQFYQQRVKKQRSQQEAWLVQRRTENMARVERGEEPLPERDPSLSIFKPIAPPSRLDSLLIRSQIGTYCDQINKFAGSSFGKLYLMRAMQQ